MEDNIIEANQLVAMTELHLQILHQIANTYNNVLNNNLNDTMKFLTGISILMTIPDIVTGFFGMNVQIPFTEFRHGWAIILLIIASRLDRRVADYQAHYERLTKHLPT